MNQNTARKVPVFLENIQLKINSKFFLDTQTKIEFIKVEQYLFKSSWPTLVKIIIIFFLTI